MTVELRVVDGGHPDVASAMQAYFDELDVRFRHGFDPGDAIESAARDFSKPRGLFVLAYDVDVIAGGGGLSLLDAETAEIKRMWVAPASRGVGLARRLLRHLEVEAARGGRTRLLLDTNSTLTEAVALYESSGYEAIDRYNDNPYAERWFEKRLASSS